MARRSGKERGLRVDRAAHVDGGQERGDRLRWILQVRVHDDDDVAAGAAETREHRPILTTIHRLPDDDRPSIATGYSREHRVGRVGAGIVDLSFQSGAMPFTPALRSLELFAQEVLPCLHSQ